MRSLGLFLVTVALGMGAGSAWAQSQTVRLGLVVGNNVGREPVRSLQYAESEVDRLADLLRGAGDFDDVVALRGATKPEIERALVQLRKRLEMAKHKGRQTLFLFYYSGHGDNEALEIGADRLLLRDLRSYLEQLVVADVRVAFIDACQSGALTGVKGGKRVPGYEVRLADPGQIKGMAIVTSSTANELSQESDDLRGSFFSQSIMAGLRGAADSSRDGQVTLGEVYHFASRRTLASTAASLTGGQHPTFDYRMAGAGEVVLTRTRPRDARLAFARESGATYLVLSKENGEVIAELSSNPSEDVYLAVPAGDYRFVRRTMGEVRERTLALAPGSVTTVEPSTMVPVVQEATRSKSSLELESRLGAYAGISTSAVPGSSDFMGTFALSYAHRLGALALRGRIGFASFAAQEAALHSTLLRAALAADVLFPVLRRYRFWLEVGPTLGMPIVRQRDNTDGEATSSYGLSYGAVLTANAHLFGRTALSLNLEGGGEVFRFNGERVHRPMGSALLGAVVGF